jgi:hypothetical protein
MTGNDRRGDAETDFSSALCAGARALNHIPTPI